MSERAQTIAGVAGRMLPLIKREREPGLFAAQKWIATREYTHAGRRYQLTVRLRFDDECSNGHNTFRATASRYDLTDKRRREDAGGMLHDEIAQHFPELAPLLKWHLCSTAGPMHYVANTLYFLGFSQYRDAVNLEHARSTAVWPEMPEEFLAAKGGDETRVRNALTARLEGLLAQFRGNIEACGFEWE